MASWGAVAVVAVSEGVDQRVELPAAGRQEGHMRAMRPCWQAFSKSLWNSEPPSPWPARMGKGAAEAEAAWEAVQRE